MSKDQSMSLRFALFPARPEDMPEVRAAREFNDTYEVNEDRDYEWLYGYAKENYDRLLTANRILDEKAGEVIKYLGGATGLAGVGLIASVKPDNVWIFPFLVPAFLTSLLAILLGLLARKPQDISHPPSTESVFKLMGECKDPIRARAYLIGSWNLAQRSLAAVMAIKAARVEWATRMVVLTLVLLFVAFVAVAVIA